MPPEGLERRLMFAAVPAGNVHGTLTTDTSFLDTTGTYFIDAPLTVAAGATLTVGPGVKIVVNANQTLTVNGAANFSTDTLTLDASPYASSTQVAVNGTLTLNGVTVAQTGGYTTGLTVNSAGEMVAKNTAFSVGQVNLNSGTVFKSGDLANDTFNSPLYLPAEDVALLSAAGGGADNASFHDINILGGTLTGSLHLSAIGTTSTAALRYVFPAGLTVAGGATLTGDANVPVLLPANQTLTVNGTASFSGDTLTLDASPYASSTQIVVGGVLNLTNATVTKAGGYTTGLTVASGGELVAHGATLSVGSLTLNNGAVFKSGDLSTTSFNLPIYLPAADVAFLSAAGGGANNRSFQDVNILGGTLAGTLHLSPIGTATIANLRFVFPGGQTVAAGSTLTVDGNLPVLLPANQTLTVNGTATFAAGDTLTLDASPYASSTQVVVNGKLTFDGDTVAQTGGYTTGLTVNSGGQLVAKNTAFSLGQVTLNSGVVFNGGDLSNDAFNQPLYLPAGDVPLLSAAGGGADNQSFQDVNILGGTLTKNLKLSLIGTATTASLRYVFPAGQTISVTAALTVDPNVPVLLPANQTLTVNGSAAFGTGDTLTLDASPYASSTQVAVNGTLTFHGATVAQTGGYTTGLTVNNGGRLIASGTVFSVGQLYVNANAVFNPGDWTGDTFKLPIYVSADDVPLLSAAGGGADNVSFQDVNILGGTLSGALSLIPIGTATTANLRYVFPGGQTIPAGADLSVDPNVSVLLPANQTLTVTGTASFAAGDTLTLDASPYASSTQVVVNGKLTLVGVTVTHTGGYSTGLTVGAGGALTSNASNVSVGALTALIADRPATGQFGSITETGSQFGTSLAAHLVGSFKPTAGDAYTLVHVAGNVAGSEAAPGTFGSAAQGSQVTVDGSTCTVNYIDGDGNDTVLVAGAAVTANLLNASDGVASAAQAQRSEVRNLLLTFNSTTALTPAMLSFRQLNGASASTDATAALGVPVVVAGSNGTQWSVPIVPGTAFSDSTGSLNDGSYALSVAVPGGAGTFAVRRLFGDFDGNGTVNALDYAKFKGAFGAGVGSTQYNSLFDFDGNGTVNALDYAQFKKRFGATLP